LDRIFACFPMPLIEISHDILWLTHCFIMIFWYGMPTHENSTHNFNELQALGIFV